MSFSPHPSLLAVAVAGRGGEKDMVSASLSRTIFPSLCCRSHSHLRLLPDLSRAVSVPYLAAPSSSARPFFQVLSPSLALSLFPISQPSPSPVRLSSNSPSFLSTFHEHEHDELLLPPPPHLEGLPLQSLKNHQFRLAKTTMIGGTIGYLPLESLQKRSATAKSDAFSFGIVVLEVVSGRRAVDLAYPDEEIVLLDWVRRLSDEGKMLQAGDGRLPDGSYSLSDMQRLTHLGLLCSLNDP
ncbi:hypothetical protein ACLOJK_009136 [Asimina triloba]